MMAPRARSARDSRRILLLPLLCMLAAGCTSDAGARRPTRAGAQPAAHAAKAPQAASTRAEGVHAGQQLAASQRVQRYLEGTATLAGLWSADSAGVWIRAPKTARTKKPAEWFIAWDETAALTQLLRRQDDSVIVRLLDRGPDSSFALARGERDSLHAVPHGTATRPLAGWRIALDPGHVAGDSGTAILEGKMVRVPGIAGKAGRPAIQIIEGALTLQTCLLLRQRLEDAGAEVFMTREKPNVTAFGKTFQEWFREDLSPSLGEDVRRGGLSPAQAAQLRRAAPGRVFWDYFRGLELRERARRINRYRPDLTLIVHYNVDESNAGWKRLSKPDYCMAFVAGNLSPDEVADPEGRLDLLRLILTDDVDRSVDLAACVVQALHDTLGVPIATPRDAEYLVKRCIPAGPAGVYCRSLALARRVRGPLAYGETLYQDAEREAVALMDRSVPVGNAKTSARVRDAAEGYYRGILAYADSTRTRAARR